MRHAEDHIYCTLHRNSSGQDSGLIDYGISISRLEKLGASDQAEILKVGAQMLREIAEYFDLPYPAEAQGSKPPLMPGDSP